MKFIDVGGINICYKIKGRGPKVLYISGSTSDIRLNPSFFDFKWTSEFTVMTYDQRGLGQSSKPDIPYTMDTYADDASDLLRTIGWGKVMVIGYSFGGMVAQELALRHPDLVEKLVLVSTTAGGAGGSSVAFHKLPKMSDRESVLFDITNTDTLHDKRWMLSNKDQLNNLIEEGLRKLKIRKNTPGFSIGRRRQLEARSMHNTWDRLGDIKIPTLVFAGKRDAIALTSYQENLAKKIPNSEFYLFDGGHALLWQDEKSGEKIKDFFSND